MATLERGGATIGYEVTGDGPAVVLGHSLLCDGRMWDPVLPALAADGARRLINVDFRGHRRSTSARPFTLDDLADDWLAILERERVDRAVLCGLSMGGMTALRLALQAPDRVAGLVLLDTSAGPQPLAEKLRFRAMAEIVRYLGFRRVLFGPVNQALFGRTALRERPLLVKNLDAQIRQHDPRQLYRAVRAVIERDDIRPRLPRLRMPTLVLVGEEDAATPPPNAREIARAIEGAVLETIPETGHLATLESPDTVGARIDDFLQQIGW